MEKTPIKTLIEYCIKNAEKLIDKQGNEFIAIDYELMQDEFDTLLEKEKQMVIDAHLMGIDYAIHADDDPYEHRGEQYYTDKYTLKD